MTIYQKVVKLSDGSEVNEVEFKVDGATITISAYDEPSAYEIEKHLKKILGLSVHIEAN
tara:strand:- start:215 stop:391 length:177 start_codon:yes stop_codon:yes gene_type:complete